MNIQKMMKQAQDMQNKLTQLQTEMDAKEFEGSAGGGALKITLTGKGKMTAISIDASLMDAAEKDMLEDLIIAAHNDAKDKADTAMQSAMGDVTGGMKLPTGFKMPF